MSDRMGKIIAAGEADAEVYRAEERAAVVAWLRRQEWFVRLSPDHFRTRKPHEFADMIEAGDHLKEQGQ